MVLMRKDVLYECVKTYVMKRKEDPYAFFTPSLRTRKFNFSCCDMLSGGESQVEATVGCGHSYIL